MRLMDGGVSDSDSDADGCGVTPVDSVTNNDACHWCRVTIMLVDGGYFSYWLHVKE